ncbi:MAG: hypothetical protein ACPGPF_10310 [Pontibacterium sp.]
MATSFFGTVGELSKTVDAETLTAGGAAVGLLLALGVAEFGVSWRELGGCISGVWGGVWGAPLSFAGLPVLVSGVKLGRST